MSELIHIVKEKLLISSETIAVETNTQHKNVMEIIRKYSDDLNEFSPFAFQTRKGEALPHGGFGKSTQYAMLNEPQATLLITYMRNTKTVRQFKKRLVKAFYEMASMLRNKKLAETEYLPFYHDLHDQVKSLAHVAEESGSKTPEKIFHINYNKMINKAFGLQSNERSKLLPEQRVVLTAANLVACRSTAKAISDGKNHKEAYQIAKADVTRYAESFGNTVQSILTN